MSPTRIWHDAERKKALIKRSMTQDDVSLFLYQWVEHLERRIHELERKYIENTVIIKPKPRP
jgi:hypothetical protein